MIECAVLVGHVNLEEVSAGQLLLADITSHGALGRAVFHHDTVHLHHVGLHEIFVAKFFLADLTVAPTQTGWLLVGISVKARSLQGAHWNIDASSAQVLFHLIKKAWTWKTLHLLENVERFIRKLWKTIC